MSRPADGEQLEPGLGEMTDQKISYRFLVGLTGALALMASAGNSAAQDAPVPVADLHASMFAWKDQPVTFGGYLDIATRRGKINRRLSFTSEPEGEISMADCELTDPSGERVKREQPIVIKGTFTHFDDATPERKPKLHMKECEVVSIGEAFDQNVPAEPGSEQIIPIGTLYEAITGGVGTEVSVTGYYRGSGHSSANDLTAVNLSPAQGGKAVVNCHIAGKDVVPANLKDNREGVVMTGTIGQPGWDIVNLYDCAFVNR
ncbi:MAG: hypothetical protein K5872_03915 [Rhizobiaceae bacterium]|nr:hypothetical protein [Rhizobiaceae bacterium]MCV0405358.1 hypothetical protein [Rhizobiaceae bacterium]